MRRDVFRAMGVAVAVGGAQPAELAAVRRLFDGWDRVFSRFRPDSELSRVNAVRAPAVVVSPLLARAVAAALDAARATGGLVDPTLGRALASAGYDRDLAALPADGGPPGPAAPGRWWDVALAGRVLTRPAGVQLDLNGVVKSLAADEALRLLGGDGFVSAGGDVAARGSAVVGLPGGGSIRLRDGGIATSSTVERRWLRGGREQHHLIDPHTGLPSESRWTHVTVAAASCLVADVAAKAALLLSDDGPGWLDERGLPGLFRDAGAAVPNRAWRDAGLAVQAAA
jgi:FAD:protein FMN transferase